MKTVLLTGGTSGVGRATLEILCESQEYFVEFTYSNSVDIKEHLESKFTNCRGYFCDFRQQDSVDIFLRIINSKSYDVLINNAYVGNLLETNFHKIECDVFHKDFTQNIIPVIKITQAVVVNMRKQKRGSIINILSSAIRNPPLGSASYVGVKSYLAMLSKSWAKEYARFNISSNAVLPSMMETKMLQTIDERIIDQVKQNTPNKELLTTLETAQIIIGIVNSTHKMTGQELLIDSANNI